MPFSELEVKRFDRAVGQFIERRRPPPHLRAKLDLAYRMQGQSIEIFQIHPHFEGRGRLVELPVAKATYVRGEQSWKIFWQRADLKWHSYQPRPKVRSIDEFLAIVDQDEHACFFG